MQPDRSEHEIRIRLEALDRRCREAAPNLYINEDATSGAETRHVAEVYKLHLFPLCTKIYQYVLSPDQRINLKTSSVAR